jgi:CBS domain-containing protein
LRTVGGHSRFRERAPAVLDRQPGMELGTSRGMDVRALMRPNPITLAVTDTLDIADDLMNLGRIRHLPVVDGRRVMGIVSQRDLLRAAVSCLLGLGRAVEQDWLRKIAVATVMTPRVFTVSPSTPLQTAVAIMIDKRIGCLPVVENGRLIGILTETDCLSRLRALLEIDETRKGLSELAPR